MSGSEVSTKRITVWQRDPNHESSIEAYVQHSTNDCTTVNPDRFTAFMKVLQSPEALAPRMQVKHFTVPASFVHILIVQI